MKVLNSGNQVQWCNCNTWGKGGKSSRGRLEIMLSPPVQYLLRTISSKKMNCDLHALPIVQALCDYYGIPQRDSVVADRT